MFLSQNTVWIFTLDNVSKSKITTKVKEQFSSFWQKNVNNIEKRYYCELYCVLICTCTLIICTTLLSSTRYELEAAGWCGSSIAFNVFELRSKEILKKRYFCVLYCVLMCTTTTLLSCTRYELGAADWCDSIAFNVFELRFKETGFTTQWQTKGKQARRLISR